MWVYDIFVSVCARNTAAKWYLPHQEKQHLTQTGRGWAGRPAKRDLTKSLLRKLHERRMHSDQIDHRSIFAKSHTSQEGWKEGESECQRKLRGAEPAKVPVRCQPVEEATTSRRRRTLGIDVSVRRDTRLSTPAALPADSRDRNAEGVALRRGPGPNAVQRPLPAGRWTPIETAKSIREDSPQPRGCETRLLPGEAPHVLTATRMQPHTRPQREPERQCAQQVWARVCRPQVV